MSITDQQIMIPRADIEKWFESFFECAELSTKIAKNKEANLVYKNNYELMFGNYSPKDVSYHTKLNPMSYRQQGATLNGKVL